MNRLLPATDRQKKQRRGRWPAAILGGGDSSIKSISTPRTIHRLSDSTRGIHICPSSATYLLPLRTSHPPKALAAAGAGVVSASAAHFNPARARHGTRLRV